jgi:hypothetical protein
VDPDGGISVRSRIRVIGEWQEKFPIDDDRLRPKNGLRNQLCSIESTNGWDSFQINLIRDYETFSIFTKTVLGGFFAIRPHVYRTAIGGPVSRRLSLESRLQSPDMRG